MALITTPVTQMLNIQHPILLAGMGHTAGSELVAAVSNATGLGVIGGLGYTPPMLHENIQGVKKLLREPDMPFGVDLLLPQLGGSARKTNVDYTKGQLDGLIDVIVEERVKLFVSAVGIPPKHVIERLHQAGILYMNMVGHPKHARKACDAGADLICAQGGEAGGHTGDIPSSVLIPACADVCRRLQSPVTGEPVQLIAAGGIFDGRGLAAALMMGAKAVWVGTRFVTARESAAPTQGKKAILDAGFDSTMRTTLWTGRPLRAVNALDILLGKYRIKGVSSGTPQRVKEPIEFSHTHGIKPHLTTFNSLDDIHTIIKLMEAGKSAGRLGIVFQ
ncbi:Nitronate monooxygenase-domain-containing protein [Aspergillus egyptiacus]|nr:Nitronate monooxygenase-domain-containing protein [Aspergillus egyptiacus]